MHIRKDEFHFFELIFDNPEGIEFQ